MGIASHWYLFLILGAIALIVFGPQRLPELGAGLGKALREFRKGASELTDTFKEEAGRPTASTPTAAGTTYVEPAPTEASAEPSDAPAAPALPESNSESGTPRA
jgi:sec-independent protein translocase protein TatA